MAIYPERKFHLKDGTTMLVRSAAVNDALPTLHYAKQIYESSPYLITEPDEFIMDVKKQELAIQTLAASRGGLFLIALVNGTIIGNLDFKSTKSRKRLMHRGSFGMSVLKSHRGLGVGQVLLEALLGWADEPENPIEKIELGVLSENEAAIRLYKKMGFQQEGLIKKAAKIAAGKYLDEIQMGLCIDERSSKVKANSP